MTKSERRKTFEEIEERIRRAGKYAGKRCSKVRTG
jgi:hypothetical protein